jgi:hypothetical protein
MRIVIRRLLLGGALVVLAAIVVAAFGLRLVHGTPDWYHPRSLTARQRQVAAQSATNKLAMLQNGAAFARADERSTRNGTTSATTTPVGMTISFTDDELNALLSEWSVWKSVRASYEKYLTDPYINIQDGRVILAGRVQEFDAIASLHFEPGIDAKGQLNFKLVRVLAGKLPLPLSAMSGYQQRIADSISTRMTWWRKRASIDSTGIANSDAVSAVLGDLLIHVFKHEPADPVVFMEVVSKGRVPVKLSQVQISDHAVMLSVQMMSPEERQELLRRIHEGGAISTVAQ